MNQTEQVLLQAIQKSLWNKDIKFPKDIDWNAELNEAEDHAVLGIVISVAPEVYQKEWRSRSGYVTANFIRLLHYQEQLCRLLQENDIPMVIIKGSAAAIYYPNPVQRTMGDIDYLVPAESFDKAKELLVANGYTVEEDLKYTRHIDARKNGISFEMHRYFADEEFSEMDCFLLEGMKRAKAGALYQTTFSMLPPLENGLVLLGHVAHHLKESLGIRQIIDWMMFVEKELDNSFWENSFSKAAEEVGLKTLAITATRMCQIYLGLPERITWCQDANENLCQSLMDNIMESGNFGRKNGSGTSVEKTVSNLKKGGFRYLQTAGEYNWKAYQKHKWLKPFAWIYQVGRYMKQGSRTKRTKDQLLHDYERGDRRHILLRCLEIGKKQ